MNSVSIKTKLYRLFSRFCPALRSGFFIEENINLRGLTPIVATEDVGEASVVVPAGCKIADTADRTGASGTEVQSAVAADGAADADISVDQDGFDDASAEVGVACIICLDEHTLIASGGARRWVVPSNQHVWKATRMWFASGLHRATLVRHILWDCCPSALSRPSASTIESTQALTPLMLPFT